MSLTLLIAATHSYKVLAPILKATRALNLVDEVEVLFLCSSLADFGAPEDWDWGSFRVVETGQQLTVHRLRARGVREADSDYVALMEDHALPEPDWLEHILPHLSHGYGAVGPAVIPAGQEGAVVKAIFLLTYAEWAGHTETSEINFVSGHNSVYRREPLLNSADLETEMACPAVLQARLRKDGFKILFEPSAVVHHWDSSSIDGACTILFALGQAFGVARTHRWPRLAQKLYPLALPLIQFLHWFRAAKQFPRVKRDSNFGPECLIVAWGLAGVWASGEALGSLKREPGTLDRLSELEVNRWRFTRPEERPQDAR